MLPDLGIAEGINGLQAWILQYPLDLIEEKLRQHQD